MLNIKENIGTLDRRITFQEAVYSTDESNQKKITGWTDIDSNPTVSASVDDKSGNEFYQADQLVALQTKEIVVRYRSDINTAMTVLYNSVRHNIKAISEVGRRRYLSILCVSGGDFVDETFGSFSEDFSDEFNT